MIRQPRFARFVLPLLLSLCQPSFAAELRAVAEARRQELLLEDSPVACGEAGCTARESLSLVALQVQARVLVTRLSRDDFPRSPASPPPSRTTACSAISAWRQALRLASVDRRERGGGRVAFLTFPMAAPQAALGGLFPARTRPVATDRVFFLANALSLRPTRTVLRLYAWLSAELFWSSFTN